ncbi:hypothetical protein E1301_Tti018142 [Triplophysa tibetana]|uniref:DUF4806 domain-containing protein n=1 Tax=Triplophysa tibetana TaxID=1572043 RepID=A0A5A9PHK6_9TELE|nr:hypothetical protein E1301_Tti018142 [Triplophysa tibetana]
MFTVVKFIETHEVELVPAMWVENGECCWPNSLRGMALHQAIKNQMAPHLDWDRWDVRTMFSTDSYEEGRKKAKEAETWSDLQSDAEVSGQRLPRRKTKSVRIGPPGGQARCSLDSEGEYAPPPKQIHPPAPIINFPTVTPATTLPAEAPATSHDSFTEMLQNWEPMDEIPLLQGCQTSRGTPQQSSETGMLREVLTKLEMVLDQQTTILRLLQLREVQVQPFDIEESSLPLQDLPHLHSLEERMQQSPEYKQKLVNWLGLIGGTDVRDCTWRILKRVIANSLAKNLNWRGVNGKTSLATLQLRDVVISAVRRNPLTANAAETDVEGTMKRWLQLAADREGGRKRRLLLKEKN